MTRNAEDDLVEVPPASQVRPPHTSQGLAFPFRANTIARRARTPGQSELQYQFAHMTTSEIRDAEGHSSGQDYFNQDDIGTRRSSVETTESADGGLPVGGPAREMMQEQISKEEALAGKEEEKEMAKALASPHSPRTQLGPVVDEERPGEDNAPAALREASDEDELIEDQMIANPAEKKRVRREQLAERLQDVFGLEDREEVLDEMRCWLLRSVSE